MLPFQFSMGRDAYLLVPSRGASLMRDVELRGVCEELPCQQACHVLERVARERPEMLTRLYTCCLGGVAACGASPFVLLAELKRGLERAGSHPAFAPVRVFTRRPAPARPAPEVVRPAPPPVAPRPARDDHYVAVLVKSAAGQALADVALELFLADGSRRALRTDALGMAALRPVPAGTCKIRLVAHAASSWGAPNVVGKGPAREHVVREGEHLMRICLRYGVNDWRAVWEDGANAALRARRKSPHVLREGDRVVLPGLDIGEVERPVDATHELRLDRAIEQTVRVRLRDAGQVGFDGLHYELSYEHAGKSVQRAGAGPTDGDGLLVERVPVEVESLVVRFKRPKLTFHLRLGALDPAQDADSGAPIGSGARARLRSLGYGSQTDDGEAVARFQAQQLGRAEPSGTLDDETCRKLEALYGT